MAISILLFYLLFSLSLSQFQPLCRLSPLLLPYTFGQTFEIYCIFIFLSPTLSSLTSR